MRGASKRAGKVWLSKSRRAGVVCYAKVCCGDLLLAFDRLNVGFALALLCAAAFALAACGRAGPMELPPGPAVGTQPTASAAPPPSSQTPLGASTASNGSIESDPAALEKAQKNGFDRYGNPVAPTGEKKSFLLDFLLQ